MQAAFQGNVVTDDVDDIADRIRDVVTRDGIGHRGVRGT